MRILRLFSGDTPIWAHLNMVWPSFDPTVAGYLLPTANSF